MDTKRQGEIALRMVKYFIWKEGLPESSNICETIAEEIKVPIEELKQFIKIIEQEFLDNFSLTNSGLTEVEIFWLLR